MNRAFSTSINNNNNNSNDENSNNKAGNSLARWKTLFSNKEKAATYSIEVKPKVLEPDIVHISNHFRLPDIEKEHLVVKKV